MIKTGFREECSLPAQKLLGVAYLIIFKVRFVSGITFNFISKFFISRRRLWLGLEEINQCFDN
jgi:hypothetical protein